MPSTLICACHNSKEVSHHKEKLYIYVQALFAKYNTVTPICLGACYHGSYGVEWLIGEVDFCLNITAKDTSEFSLQHVYIITQRNQYVCEVALIWVLEQSADPELTRTLGLDFQDNAPCCFSLALCLFVQAVKDNNPQLYLPLAVSVAHFMWYHPKVCSSGAVGFAGHCLKHFCGLAYQSKLDWYVLQFPIGVVPNVGGSFLCLCCSIPCLPAGGVPSAGTSNRPPGNGSPTSGSERHSPE
ncbi:hypothetical protein DSO57_1001170 [Entomophthora muscae]|uniref:Uncharacterized protein n=1 Tax=Entomophthora muscae TaxID=34485 RepID=A0ACC2TW19_9FUNG|nr:hypothetical protein DSO57_1001170 [Entomophthora muscae]